MLCDTIVGLRLPVALLRIEQDGAAASSFAAACHGRGRLFVVPSPPTLQVDLRGGWQAYLETRSAKLRSDIRRKIRRLETTGKVQIEFLRPTPIELDRVLEEAIDVEADGWKGRAGSALRYNSPIRRFVSSLASQFAAIGQLRVNFLRIDGSAIAMCIDLEHSGRLWSIKRGYREAFCHSSPGKILLYETLRNGCERNLSGYEFLGSGDPMQPEWATGERRLQSLVFYPYSFQGALAFAGDIASLPIRRLSRLVGR
jgi:CelD/BcsL family acetyltransferase involved in cellulose biosynthesis